MTLQPRSSISPTHHGAKVSSAHLTSGWIPFNCLAICVQFNFYQSVIFPWRIYRWKCIQDIAHQPFFHHIWIYSAELYFWIASHAQENVYAFIFYVFSILMNVKSYFVVCNEQAQNMCNGKEHAVPTYSCEFSRTQRSDRNSLRRTNIPLWHAESHQL